MRPDCQVGALVVGYHAFDGGHGGQGHGQALGCYAALSGPGGPRHPPLATRPSSVGPSLKQLSDRPNARPICPSASRR